MLDHRSMQDRPAPSTLSLREMVQQFEFFVECNSDAPGSRGTQASTVRMQSVRMIYPADRRDEDPNDQAAFSCCPDFLPFQILGRQFDLLVRRRADGALASLAKFSHATPRYDDEPEREGRVSYLQVNLSRVAEKDHPYHRETDLDEGCVVMEWPEEDWPDEDDIPELWSQSQWGLFTLTLRYSIFEGEENCEKVGNMKFTLNDLSRILTNRMRWAVFEE